MIAYARYSTNEQDLTAQRLAEQDPDLEPDRCPCALPGPRRRAHSGVTSTCVFFLRAVRRRHFVA